MIRVSNIKISGITTVQGTGTPPPSYYFSILESTYENAVRGMVADASGNVYISGYTGESGNRDTLVAKLNSDLSMVWQKRINSGANGDFASGMAVDATSVYVGSTLDSSPTSTTDFYISKHSIADGSITWQRALGGNVTQSLRDLVIDSSSNVYTVGFDTTSDAAQDWLVVKYNSSGTQQWARTLATSGSSADSAYGITVDPSGNPIAVGNSGGTGCAIAKLNSSGTPTWQNRYGSNGLFNKVAADSSGNIYAIGYQTVTGKDNDIYIVKVNSSGVVQWARRIGSTGADSGLAITVSGTRVFVAGSVIVPSGVNAGKTGSFVAEYNTSGTLVWQRIVSTQYSTVVNRIILVDSNIYLGGQLLVGALNQGFMAKLPADGSLTGTHGIFTYATSTLAGDSPTVSGTGALPSGALVTRTAYTPVFTLANTSITVNKTSFQ